MKLKDNLCPTGPMKVGVRQTIKMDSLSLMFRLNKRKEERVGINASIDLGTSVDKLGRDTRPLLWIIEGALRRDTRRLRKP